MKRKIFISFVKPSYLGARDPARLYLGWSGSRKSSKPVAVDPGPNLSPSPGRLEIKALLGKVPNGAVVVI